ncbi:MAG TPA: hypothetical protein VF278_24705 [Pirellulales bacterium]
MRPLFQIMAAYCLISPLSPEATAAEPPPRRLCLQTNLQVSENVTAGIDGAMYTTWQHNFGESEAFAGYAWNGKRPQPKE